MTLIATPAQEGLDFHSHHRSILGRDREVKRVCLQEEEVTAAIQAFASISTAIHERVTGAWSMACPRGPEVHEAANAASPATTALLARLRLTTANHATTASLECSRASRCRPRHLDATYAPPHGLG